jgi:hypothetical protein
MIEHASIGMRHKRRELLGDVAVTYVLMALAHID